MLVRFTVENCLSFRDRVELSMIASEEAHDHPEHVIRAGGDNGVSVLKLGVIFGANASGKSNLVKAMSMARDLILNAPAAMSGSFSCRSNSTRNAGTGPVASSSRSSSATLFRLWFAVSSERVEEEWLFEIGPSDEHRIFERTGNDFKWGQPKFAR